MLIFKNKPTTYMKKYITISILSGTLLGFSLTCLYYQFLNPYNSWGNYIGKDFYEDKVQQKEIFIVYYDGENSFKRNSFLYLCTTQKIDNLPLLKVNCNERDKK